MSELVVIAVPFNYIISDSLIRAEIYVEDNTTGLTSETVSYSIDVINCPMSMTIPIDSATLNQQILVTQEMVDNAKESQKDQSAKKCC